MFRKSRIFVSALIVIAMLVSCCIPAAAATVETVDTRAVPSPTFLEVTAPSIHMTVGDTAQLTYAILPANISVSLSWYSSKTSVATVSSSGLVTAVGTGTVTITLTAASTSPLGGSISDTVTLYVRDDTGIKSGASYNDQAKAYIAAHQSVIRSVYVPDYALMDIEDSNALASLRCVMYMGCSTGLNYKSYNLVDQTFDMGAHFVVGTTYDLYTEHINLWLEYFLENVRSGLNLEHSIVLASQALGEIGVIEYESKQEITHVGLPLYYVGDGLQRLSIYPSN